MQDVLKNQLENSAASPSPEFIRLPKVGTVCPRTGLSRSILNRLILPGAEFGTKPPVRSVLLRKPGNVGGVRLIDYQSLVHYLHGLDKSVSGDERV